MKTRNNDISISLEVFIDRNTIINAAGILLLGVVVRKLFKRKKDIWEG